METFQVTNLTEKQMVAAQKKQKARDYAAAGWAIHLKRLDNDFEPTFKQLKVLGNLDRRITAPPQFTQYVMNFNLQ